MQEICKYLADVAGNNNVYYSVENNTLGEAALVVISQMGEEHIPGVFLSEPRNQGGGGTRFRKGFNTSNKSKLAACAKLKSLVEGKRMRVASKMLISEFKNFVAKGNSYEAKIGEHDDLIMAVLLCIRMMQLLQEFDANMDAELRDNADNFVEPMPFIMVGNY
jgi:aryl carrier-like protein